ncbi:hypothetical protein NDU88_004939 [Pleurodeles waltl]|uniref:Uncharacterized protein n=1 Tax=Pleurodeles waltl TaxID=8319 RepID=A0AAV7SK83_PLEWA|nr:hypothetical protein NDU88_004939 [Pleurodeles waltl]
MEEDTGDTWMDVVEVSASEVCVLLGVVMVVVAVEAVHADVSVNVTVSEEEEVEEGETVESVDVVVRTIEEETGNAPVAAVDPEDSEDEEAEDEYVDNRTSTIRQYFQ